MAVTVASKKKRAWIVVNAGTSAAPSYQNRYIGTGYPISTTATDTLIYQLANSFSELQTNTLEKVKVDEVSILQNS